MGPEDWEVSLNCVGFARMLEFFLLHLFYFFSFPGADPGEGKRVTILPPSLSLLAVICSRFFVVEVIFFRFLISSKDDQRGQ